MNNGLVITDSMQNSPVNRAFCAEIMALIRRNRIRSPELESRGNQIRIIDSAVPVKDDHGYIKDNRGFIRGFEPA